MASLLSNYFAAAEGTHPRQKQTAATNPELAQVRQDVDKLTAKAEKLASVVDQIFAAGDKVAAAVPSIVEKYFADRGAKVRLVRSETPGGDAGPLMSQFFGQAQKSLRVSEGQKRIISRQQREACAAIWGKDFPACKQDEVSDYE